MERSILQPKDIYTPVGDYSHAVKVRGGGMIFLAGQAALDAQGKLVGEGDVEQQTRRTFDKIKSLLEAGGASLNDLVKTTTYLLDMADYPKFAQVRREYLQKPFPPNTVVVVKGLPIAGSLIEIEAIAVTEG